METVATALYAISLICFATACFLAWNAPAKSKPKAKRSTYTAPAAKAERAGHRRAAEYEWSNRNG